MSDGNFVDSLVSDPSEVPDLVFLTGYVGDSLEEDHVRLYLNPHLSEWLEIPEEAVLHREEVSSTALGGHYLWVNSDAELIRRGTRASDVKAKFFSGKIQQNFAAQGGGPIGPTGVQHCTAAPAHCGNTQWQGCPGGGPIGPTGVQHCTAAPAYCGNTQWQGCPGGGPIGPTGVQHCTAAPAYCGNTQWQGCPWTP